MVVVDKPAGLLIHPPESRTETNSRPTTPDVVRILRNQCAKRVYPVHRLDRATSGVLVMAFSPEVARLLQEQFQSKSVQKTYVALVRGYTEDRGVIDTPLTARLDGGVEKESLTHYETYYRFELPIASSKFSTSRFSIVKVSPQTGRLHQIRRHFKRISHPLIGDTVHGDGTQNRIWKELTGEKLLYLKAYRLQFSHPQTGEKMIFRSRFSRFWQKVFDHAGFCPLI